MATRLNSRCGAQPIGIVSSSACISSSSTRAKLPKR